MPARWSAAHRCSSRRWTPIDTPSRLSTDGCLEQTSRAASAGLTGSGGPRTLSVREHGCTRLGSAAYVPLPLPGGERRLNAESAVAAGGALLVDDAGLYPAWIEATLIPVLTDPGRLAVMSARASAAGAPDADVVLARHVLTAVAGRRSLAS
jgi:hypothetical protein